MVEEGDVIEQVVETALADLFKLMKEKRPENGSERGSKVSSKLGIHVENIS